MRDAFFSELLDLFSRDDRVVFLTGDLGYKLFDPLSRVDAERVINFGIREGAMVGFAAGLARTGMLPFVYSIVPFVTLRCLEQTKLDLCYNRSRVVLVGVGGGFAYGPNGPTHHGVDDVGVLSCLPGLYVWTPADPQEVRGCVRMVPELNGPAYLRLGRNGEPNLHKEVPDVHAPMTIRQGEHGTVFCCGVILHEVLSACELLAADRLRPRVVHLPTLRPFPKNSIAEILTDGSPVLAVEEHVSTGGLGREVASCIAETGRAIPFQTLHIPDGFPGTCMSRSACLEWAGISAAAIARTWRRLATRTADH